MQELIQILKPFAEATDLTQGDSVVTISCVLPVVLSLARSLQGLIEEGNNLTALMNNLDTRILDTFLLLVAISIRPKNHL